MKKYICFFCIYIHYVLVLKVPKYKIYFSSNIWQNYQKQAEMAYKSRKQIRQPIGLMRLDGQQGLRGFCDRWTDRVTNGWTLVLVKLLSRLKKLDKNESTLLLSARFRLMLSSSGPGHVKVNSIELQGPQDKCCQARVQAMSRYQCHCRPNSKIVELKDYYF